MPTVYRQIVPCCVFAGLLAAVLGCDTSSQFAADELLLASNRIVPAHRTACEELLADQFGTPDEPRIPASLDDMFDAQLLELAAGEVISHTEGVTHGLYRRHCARCHGVTGDGRGPTALYQHPYPRDYRRGVFKYKSTQRGAPPTDADLHGVLERGVAGTAMPSFALLAQQERDALVQYVKYLAIRGQAERALVDYVAEELEFDPQTGEVEAGSELSASSPDDQELVAEIVADVADRWRSAEGRVVTATPPSDLDDRRRIEAGRALFHNTKLANCTKCHGENGAGEAVVQDLDDWNKRRQDFLDRTDSLRASLTTLRERIATAESAGSDMLREQLHDQSDLIAEREVVAAGMLPPMPADARVLAGGVLRGGKQPIDLYRAIHQGIAGSPMPGVGDAVSEDDIWNLVAYVQSLLADSPN